MDERDLLPASTRPDTNCNVYPQYSWIDGRVASLKDFFTASTKRLSTQCLLQKYKSKAYGT